MKDLNADGLTLSKTIYLKAPPEAVWAHLTEADKLAAWFHPAERNLQEGADYALLGDEGSPVCWGRVTKMERPRRLAYTFTIKPLDGRMTSVEWTLDPVEGGTRLTLLHSGLPEGETGFGLFTALDAGWDRHLLRLREI